MIVTVTVGEGALDSVAREESVVYEIRVLELDPSRMGIVAT